MENKFFTIVISLLLILFVYSCKKEVCLCGLFYNNQLIKNETEQEKFKGNCSDQSDMRPFPSTVDTAGNVIFLPDTLPRFKCR